MQQLSGLDTSFLNMETSTTYGHVSGLAVFDPSTAAKPATNIQRNGSSTETSVLKAARPDW